MLSLAEKLREAFEATRVWYPLRNSCDSHLLFSLVYVSNGVHSFPRRGNRLITFRLLSGTTKSLELHSYRFRGSSCPLGSRQYHTDSALSSKGTLNAREAFGLSS